MAKNTLKKASFANPSSELKRLQTQRNELSKDITLIEDDINSHQIKLKSKKDELKKVLDDIEEIKKQQLIVSEHALLRYIERRMGIDMESIREDTIGGFNSFLREQKSTSNGDLLTLVQFDDQYETIHDGVSISDVPELDNKTFQPRGMTALFDAIGRIINSTGARLSNMPEKDRPGRVIFVIITDGLENASKEFTDRKQVFDMITHQTDKYNWQFLYLGANQDAISVGQGLGINIASSMSYSASSVGTTKSWDAMSRSVTSRKFGNSVRDSAFTDAERDETADDHLA